MPTVHAPVDILLEKIGKHLSVEEFEAICFEFGIELDGLEDEKWEGGVAKIDIPANRIDLLCVEGIGAALKCFIGLGCAPQFKVPDINASSAKGDQKLVVKASTAKIRPYAVSAILKNVEFTEASFKSFIDLQDKLHHTICRRRSIVAIGTHDLDAVEGPFTYDAMAPENINFIPLNQTVSHNGHAIMQLYEKHAQLKAYLDIIRESPIYPVIFDKNGTVLSLPPIINGERSKITLNTKNVYIECTATDLHKAEIVLNTLVAMFSNYCSPTFEIHPVEVCYEEDHPHKGGIHHIYPKVDCFPMEASLKFVQNFTGIPGLTQNGMVKMLSRMMIDSSASSTDEDKVVAQVPITRSDILHQCDLAEDVAIAYGYNKIKPIFPSFINQLSMNSLVNQARNCFALNGFYECLNWGLCSFAESYTMLRRSLPDSQANLKISGETDGHETSPTAAGSPSGKEFTDYQLVRPVRLKNPKTKEFEICRTSLLPGLLKSAAAHKGAELPLKLYELGDIVALDEAAETGGRNISRCAVLYANSSTAGLAEVHGMLDTLMERFNIVADYTIKERNLDTSHGDSTLKECYYSLEPSKDPAFLPQCQVSITLKPGGTIIGAMGMLHPDVLKAYNVTVPGSCFEIDLEPLLRLTLPTDLYEQ